MTRADIVIIGSGMGGATLAHALAPSGQRIVILERGQRLTDTEEARSDMAIFADGHFRPNETWEDGAGVPFNPGNYYYVGGNSKFYGAVMLRYRAEDFIRMQHLDGVSPAWPIGYDTLAPYYDQAEALYQVRGDAEADPTEPAHSAPYPYPPVPHEADIAHMAQRLRAAGVTPSPLPLAVDSAAWLARAATPWDAFPDTTGAKLNAETVLDAALAHDNVTLLTGTKATRLETAPDGVISAVLVEPDDKNTAPQRIEAGRVILSAGAVNSAALLLGSTSEAFPHGVANRSDMVGRNFMNHNTSAILALHPLRRNRAVYQKTLQFNDYYLTGGPDGAPLGNVQLLGKISGAILSAQTGLPSALTNALAARSHDWYAMSEDLPDPNSRVSLKNGRIVLDWKRSNMRAHELLVQKAKATLRRAGFPIVLSRGFDRRTPSHQCGTVRFGTDPMQAPLDTMCRAHDHPNLYVVDASFLPSSAAVNPALTIAAMALRVAEHIREAAA